MSVHDLVFSVVATGETIYDPLTLTTATSTVLRVTNYGSDDLSNLGMWVIPATTVGDVDNPADYPAETDYQDLLTWGQAVDASLAVQGGIKLTLPQTGGGSLINYVTREKAATRRTKLAFTDLAAGASADFTVTLETPPAVTARRLFINLVLE